MPPHYDAPSNPLFPNVFKGVSIMSIKHAVSVVFGSLIVLSTMAQASDIGPRSDLRDDRRELREDRRDLRQDVRERNASHREVR